MRVIGRSQNSKSTVCNSKICNPCSWRRILMIYIPGWSKNHRSWSETQILTASWLIETGQPSLLTSTRSMATSTICTAVMSARNTRELFFLDHLWRNLKLQPLRQPVEVSQWSLIKRQVRLKTSVSFPNATNADCQWNLTACSSTSRIVSNFIARTQ